MMAAKRPFDRPTGRRLASPSKVRRAGRPMVGVLLASLLLAGCGSKVFEPTPHAVPLSGSMALSATASLHHIVVLERGSNLVLCGHPQPDSSFNQEDGGMVGFGFGGASEKTGLEEGSSEGELTGRTPAVLMTRELFFRACEFSRNYNLTKEEATALYLQTLKTTAQGWSTEAHNTTVTIGESLTVQQDVSTTLANPPQPDQVYLDSSDDEDEDEDEEGETDES